MSLWDKQENDFVWRRCGACGYRAEPVSYENDDVAVGRECPDCGAVMKFWIKGAGDCLVIWNERSGGR
jgi:hypothetical protein